MSSFRTNLCVEALVDAYGHDLCNRDGRQLWRVIDHPFVYSSDVAETTIVIPVGFLTDFASIPQFLLGIFGDVAQRASIPHDFEYSGKGTLSRELADKVLQEACLLSGVPGWKANLIYAGVRLAGASHFRIRGE